MSETVSCPSGWKPVIYCCATQELEELIEGVEADGISVNGDDAEATGAAARHDRQQVRSRLRRQSALLDCYMRPASFLQYVLDPKVVTQQHPSVRIPDVSASRPTFSARANRSREENGTLFW